MSNEEKLNPQERFFDQINSYFQLNKNLLIKEIIFFNRDKLENPDIICLLEAETIYNVHTGKLIVSGGSVEGFYQHVKESYKLTSKLDNQVQMILSSLASMKERDMVEYIPDGESYKSYLDSFINTDEGISDGKTGDSSLN